MNSRLEYIKNSGFLNKSRLTIDPQKKSYGESKYVPDFNEVVYLTELDVPGSSPFRVGDGKSIVGDLVEVQLEDLPGYVVEDKTDIEDAPTEDLEDAQDSNSEVDE